MLISDALSRLPFHNTEKGNETEIKGLKITVHDVETDIHESTLNKIRRHTRTDPALSLVMQYVMDGWPHTSQECAEPTRSYFTYREELTIVDGLLVKGSRIIIPTNM